MTAFERDFSNYQFGDSVYELAGGLLPDMAEQLEIRLGEVPEADTLQAMLKRVGEKKQLRDNLGVVADYITPEQAAEFVERSGVQKAVDRDLWAGNVSSVEAGARDALILGGVANWTDRMAEVVATHPTAQKVWTIGGTREMKTPTELVNPNNARLIETFKLRRSPTEAQYLGAVVVPSLIKRGKNVFPSAYPTDNGDELLRQFFGENPQLLEEKLLLARVANSGIIMGLQVRAAARLHNPDFDRDPANPQLFVATDAFQVARTEEQRQDAAHYQNPSTAIRQVILTGKKLVEAQAAE